MQNLESNTTVPLASPLPFTHTQNLSGSFTFALWNAAGRKLAREMQQTGDLLVKSSRQGACL